MEDDPRTVAEFEARFSTEEACRQYLVWMRWPDGFRCPKCCGMKASVVRETLFQCTRCRRQASVTAGTVFQDIRKPLIMGFRAMWYVTSQKNGASALGIQRVLGLGSYQTAWTWLHKLRRATVRPGRDKLSGWVEVDETYFGGLEEGKAGRGGIDKALIVIAAEADGKAITIVVPGTARAELASERCGGEAGAVRGGRVDGTVLAATISVKRPQVG